MKFVLHILEPDYKPLNLNIDPLFFMKIETFKLNK